MSPWFTLILGIGVVWRVTRFILLDSLIHGYRKKLLGWLDQPRPGHPWRDYWADKAWQLATCPWCMSIWVSAGFIVITNVWLWDIPAPVWMWLAVAAFALVPYNYLDGDDH